MAYREIGTGGMSASWLFTGMGRLSLLAARGKDSFFFTHSNPHGSRPRPVPRRREVVSCHSQSLTPPSLTTRFNRFLPVQRFSHEEKQTRKRVWWGCIILDRYTASYIGRPGTIHERDYDTSFPSEDEPDEHEQWKPLRPDGTECSSPPKADSDQPRSSTLARYPPTKTHTLSCFNAAGALAVIINRVRPFFTQKSHSLNRVPVDHRQHLRDPRARAGPEQRDAPVAARPEPRELVSRTPPAPRIQPSVEEDPSATREHRAGV